MSCKVIQELKGLTQILSLVHLKEVAVLSAGKPGS